jgi:hypothetical protein
MKFSEKKKNWITAPCHTINYTSWKQWTDVEVFNSPLWKDAFFPYLWNIQEGGDVTKIQILYTPLTGSYISFGSTVDIKLCIITIKLSDEEDIQEWLNAQVWAHMV